MIRSALSFLACSALTATAADSFTLTLKPLTAQMRYDTTEFTVTPGSQVKFTFENTDDIPHNAVFCQPGTNVLEMANKQMEKPDEAVKRNWLPDDKRIWAHTKLLNPHEKDELNFTAPEKAGDYPFVCTFPGHAMTMNGVLHVLKQGEGLKDLTFKLYLGSWKKLPDFDALTPHREGKVPNNLVQLKLDDYKNEFGVVYTGKLTAPVKGLYKFHLAGDDGVRISVDGKQVVEHDGIHPAGSSHTGVITLKEGEHTFRLDFFQAAGGAEIYAAWQGPGFDLTPLSKDSHPDWAGGGRKKKKEDRTTGIPLAVTNEPVIYRNFIQGAGTRGIGVGYPGGFNIAWSAETMNLALIWRGAFMDAARHWNDRGGGYQPPLGYDILKPMPEGGLPFLEASTPSAEWPKLDAKQRAEDYQWQGYKLDAQGRPTFRYRWHELSVEDSFTTEGQGTKPDGRLVRHITIQGKVANPVWLRVASAPKIEAKDGGFIVQGTPSYRLTAAGATLAGDNIVVPVKEGTVQVVYQWMP